MKKITFLFFPFFALLMIFSSLKAQNASVSGIIIDSDSLYSIPKVSIFLLDVNQNVIAKSISDNKGLFSIPNVSDGTYKIRTITPGYKVMISKPFSISSKNQRNNFKIKIKNLEQGEMSIFNEIDYNDYLDLLEDRELLNDDK